jgi:hypothetical protein
MNNLYKLIVCAVRAGATVLVLTAPPAFATVDKCQKALERAGSKLQTDAIRALTRCADTIRKAAPTADSVSQSAVGADATATPAKSPAERAADACEALLARVFDKGGTMPGRSSIDRFKATVDSLVPGTCTATDLFALGHLLSGAAGTAPPAPGSSPGVQEWAKNWLAMANVSTAVMQEIMQARDLLNEIGAMIDTVGDCGDAQIRPNLCQFAIQCRDQACQIAASSRASITLATGATTPIALGGQLVLQVCTMKNSGLLGTNGEFVSLVGGPARTIRVPAIAGTTICVDQVAAEGWCDCSGLGVSVDTAICQDHIESNGEGCLGPSTGIFPTSETPCFCDDGSGQLGAQCGPSLPSCPSGSACGKKASGGRCHPGTANGPIKTLVTGASSPGDCVLLDTLQFKVLPSAAAFGPDGQPCTSDDTLPPVATVPVPMSTGTATALLKDAVITEGSCDGGKTRCVENANCADGLCVGAVTGDITSPPVTGARASSCAMLEAGKLSGLQLVGGLTSLDVLGLGDLAATFQIVCE